MFEINLNLIFLVYFFVVKLFFLHYCPILHYTLCWLNAFVAWIILDFITVLCFKYQSFIYLFNPFMFYYYWISFLFCIYPQLDSTCRAVRVWWARPRVSDNCLLTVVAWTTGDAVVRAWIRLVLSRGAGQGQRRAQGTVMTLRENNPVSQAR